MLRSCLVTTRAPNSIFVRSFKPFARRRSVFINRALNKLSDDPLESDTLWMMFILCALHRTLKLVPLAPHSRRNSSRMVFQFRLAPIECDSKSGTASSTFLTRVNRHHLSVADYFKDNKLLRACHLVSGPVRPFCHRPKRSVLWREPRNLDRE